MKLITFFFLALAIVPYQLMSQNGAHQDKFINCIHENEEDSIDGSKSVEIEFSVRQIQIFEMVGIEPEPQYISIELVSDENIDSIKFRESFGEEQFMLDDGLNGDLQANDNIYTTSSPIQISTTFTGSSRPFVTRRTRGVFSFYLNDESIQKYSSNFSSYFFTEEGYDQFQDHIAKNSVTQLNDSTFYTSNIIHIVSDTKTYSSSSIDYNLAYFNDLDEIMGEDYGKEEVLIYLSYNDIDKETGGSAASYWNGLTNYIRTKSFSYTLLNHETLHEWVGSFFTYDLAPNNGHWGFIERPTSAFGSGCYHGVFQNYSVDPSSGLVVGTSQNSSFHFSNLELFLMQRLPIDSVEFPLYYVSGEDIDCSFSGIENGNIDSLSQEEFLERYDAEQEFGSLTDFGDTIEYKTVVLYDQRLSDEVIHLLSFEIKLYEDFFAESTRQHCFASTSIFNDSDGDGFTADLDCDDTNSMINPDQLEEPYNGLDDDCDEMTLDDDLDLDGFLLADDCDDENADINPNQAEEPYNGLDDDCDEMTLDDDLDQDGFLLVDDCDDENADINPNAEEIANNGIDEDCDGMDMVTSTYELSNSEIKIYPNPAIDVIYIEVSGQLRFTASLFDLNGKVVLVSSNNQSISVNSIAHGIYYLEIRDQNSGQKVIEKILVGLDH